MVRINTGDESISLEQLKGMYLTDQESIINLLLIGRGGDRKTEAGTAKLSDILGNQEKYPVG